MSFKEGELSLSLSLSLSVRERIMPIDIYTSDHLKSTGISQSRFEV